LAVTDWRLRRWRLWFMALMTATQKITSHGANFRSYLECFDPMICCWIFGKYDGSAARGATSAALAAPP